MPLAPAVLAVFAALVAGASAEQTAARCAAGFPKPEADVFTCELSDGQLEIDIENNLQYMNIDCGGAALRCAELPALGRLRNATVPNVALYRCDMGEEGVECALRALGARGGTRALRLQGAPGGLLRTLRPAILTDLPLRALTLREDATTSGEYTPASELAHVLAAVPTLLNLTVMGGRLRLESDGFEGSPPLVRLNLVSCGLTELPPRAFVGLPRLRRLIVFNNPVETVSADALEGLTELEELELSGSRVRALPPALLATPRALRSLRLLNTPLGALEAPLLAGLAQLRELRVQSGAALTLGTRVLAGLPALQEVVLRRCALATLPLDALIGSVALQHLDLAHNRLTRLPLGLFADQGDLQTLNLTHNLLEELPDGVFAGLRTLRALDVSDNLLTRVGLNAMGGARALRWLSLARNALTLDPMAAGTYATGWALPSPLQLPELQHLDLHGNRVRALTDDWRIALLQLRTLNLSNNAFDFLWSTDFDFVQQNITVDLRFNNITTIVQYGAHRINAGGATVLLDGNPFDCDCQLYEFLVQQWNDSVSSVHVELGAAQCAAPTTLQGHPLRFIQLDAMQCAAANCPAGCDCVRAPHARRIRLHCAIPPAATDLVRLAAAAAAEDSRNYSVALRLSSAPPPAATLLPLITELDLSRLNLTAVPAAALHPGLALLDLSDNELEAAPPALLASGTGPQLWLAGNPLACDCAHADEVAALQRQAERIRDYERVTCALGGPVGSRDVTALCVRHTAVVLGSSLAALGLLFAAGALLAWRHWPRVQRVAFRWGFGGDPDHNKPYDAFVSFCHEDHWFVTEELARPLESGSRPLRLCLHHRDWQAGEWVPAQIARSVREARRTLLVVSEHYAASRWTLLEFRAAQERAILENRVRVVAVVLGDAAQNPRLPADLRDHLRLNTYLQWGASDFWPRLRAALGEPPPRTLPATDATPCKPPALAARWQTREGRLVHAAL